MSVKGTKTEENLLLAFARESQTNRRFLYFAQKADIEGYPDIAVLFKNIAEGETGHALGHLEYLASLGSGDPATGMEVGDTLDNLRSAVVSETFESNDLYPGFAAAARAEGFAEVAEWFDTLARAETAHVAKLRDVLDTLR